MKASEIIDCDCCPLYKKDCIGGYSSDGSGEPIEPPCIYWNDNDNVEEGMYELSGFKWK